MATSAVYVTLPVVAAAAGLFFFGRNDPKSKELGSHGIQASIEKIVGKAVVVEMKSTPQMTKLAPQFDGLGCFETFVGQ